MNESREEGSAFVAPTPRPEVDSEIERFYALVESALVYLGDDPTNAEYLPVSLRTRPSEGIRTWRDLYERGLASGQEVIEASSRRAKANP